MGNTAYDEIDHIRTIEVWQEGRTKKQSFEIAKQLLEWHHYYFDKREKIWKLRLKLSDGDQCVWYGRILKSSDRMCVVFGFDNKKSARNCKIENTI